MSLPSRSYGRTQLSKRTLTCEVTIGQIKAALLFASKDITRVRLNGACIDHTPTGTRLITTDGHRAFIAKIDETPVEGEPVRYVIGRAILETVAKLNAKLSSVAVVWEQHTSPDPQREGVTIVSVPHIHIAGIPTEDLQVAMGAFPEYERIVPAKCSGKLAQFNVSYLADCSKAKKLLGSGEIVTVAHNGDRAALVILNENAFAIVMPMRGEAELSPPAWFPVVEAKKKAAA
jgi:hypothetical protein